MTTSIKASIFLGSYKKRNATTGEVFTVFKYGVTGSEAGLKAYKDALAMRNQPCHTDEATGKLIFFDTVKRPVNSEITINTETGYVGIIDHDFDAMQSQLRLATDPTLKAALAGAIAQQMVARIMGGASATQAVAQPASAPAFSEGDASLGE